MPLTIVALMGAYPVVASVEALGQILQPGILVHVRMEQSGRQLIRLADLVRRRVPRDPQFFVVVHSSYPDWSPAARPNLATGISFSRLRCSSTDLFVSYDNNRCRAAAASLCYILV